MSRSTELLEKAAGATTASALAFLAEPRTCTELGEHLWGQAHRHRQCYARPAGRLIQRLVATGKAKRAYPAGWERRVPQYAVAGWQKGK